VLATSRRRLLTWAGRWAGTCASGVGRGRARSERELVEGRAEPLGRTKRGGGRLRRTRIRRTVWTPGTGLFATDNQESWSSLGDTNRPHPVRDPWPTVRSAPDSHAAVAPAGCDVESCGFCGGQVGTDRRCRMCGQPVERRRDA